MALQIHRLCEVRPNGRGYLRREHYLQLVQIQTSAFTND